MRYKLLKEVFEEYLRKNQRLKWATVDGRTRAWGKLIKAKGDMNISDFTYDDAEDFQEYLFDQRLAPGAIKSYVKKVKVVFRWAWFKGYCQGDPFDGLKPPKVPQKEIRVYSKAELCAMLASADSIVWQARIIVAASAGLRRSEVLNLTVKDIDFEKGLVRVQPKKETAHTWLWSPKNYEVRRLPLTENLNSLLVTILEELPTGQPYLMLTAKRYWWLQHLRNQGKMSPRMMVNPDENFSRPYKRILHRAKISDGCFHDLRKTAITTWLLSGLAPQEVQRLAGHSDIETTLKYYAACRTDIVDRARQAWAIGATGLEPATS